jgi:WD40 repeat protein
MDGKGAYMSRQMSNIVILIFISISILSVSGRRAVAQNKYGTRLIEWSPDGKLIAIAQTDGVIVLQNSDGTIHSTLQGDSRNTMAITWRSDGAQLASGGDDPDIKIWDVSSGDLIQLIPAFSEGTFVLAWQPNGNYLLASGFSLFRVWDVETGQPITDPFSITLTDMTWSPNGTEFAFSSTQIGTSRIENGKLSGTYFEEQAREGYYYSVDYSMDGTTIISAGGVDGMVHLWDSQSGQHIRTLLETDETIQDARFLDTSGLEIGAVSDNGNVYVVDLMTDQVETFNYPSLDLWSIAVNPINNSVFSIGGVVEATNEEASIQGVETINDPSLFSDLIIRDDSEITS